MHAFVKALAINPQLQNTETQCCNMHFKIIPIQQQPINHSQAHIQAISCKVFRFASSQSKPKRAVNTEILANKVAYAQDTNQKGSRNVHLPAEEHKRVHFENNTYSNLIQCG